MAEIRSADHSRQWRILTALVFAIVYQIALGFFVTMAFIAIDDQRDADCEASLRIREETAEADIRNFNILGQEMGASQERIEQFLDRLRTSQESLPEPATCQ